MIPFYFGNVTVDSTESSCFPFGLDQNFLDLFPWNFVFKFASHWGTDIVIRNHFDMNIILLCKLTKLEIWMEFNCLNQFDENLKLDSLHCDLHIKPELLCFSIISLIICLVSLLILPFLFHFILGLSYILRYLKFLFSSILFFLHHQKTSIPVISSIKFLPFVIIDCIILFFKRKFHPLLLKYFAIEHPFLFLF